MLEIQGRKIDIHLNMNLIRLFLQHTEGDATAAGALVELSLIDGLQRLDMPDSELIKAGVSQRMLDLIKKHKV